MRSKSTFYSYSIKFIRDQWFMPSLDLGVSRKFYETSFIYEEIFVFKTVVFVRKIHRFIMNSLFLNTTRILRVYRVYRVYSTRLRQRTLLLQSRDLNAQGKVHRLRDSAWLCTGTRDHSPGTQKQTHSLLPVRQNRHAG